MFVIMKNKNIFDHFELLLQYYFIIIMFILLLI